jgi:hypothetical protein
MHKRNFLIELLRLSRNLFRIPLIIVISTYCAVYVYSIVWGSLVGDWLPFGHHQELVKMVLSSLA